jgi:hypothetical protein
MKLLSAEEKTFYEKNGFILLNNIFTSTEIEEISNEYDAIFEVVSAWATYLSVRLGSDHCS